MIIHFRFFVKYKAIGSPSIVMIKMMIIDSCCLLSNQTSIQLNKWLTQPMTPEVHT